MLKKLVCPLAFIATITLPAYAADGKYDWLLKSVEDESSDAGAMISTGTVNGKKYTAIIANRPTKEPIEYNPLIIILNSINGVNIPIAEIDLQHDYTSGYTVLIRNNSIFIRSDTGHHGIYFRQYQFKDINGEFYLVGIESQSITLSMYSADEEEMKSSDYQEVDMWQGTSANLLTSKAECWLQTFALPQGDKKPNESSPEWREWKAAVDSINSRRIARPANGVRQKVNFQRKIKIPLNQFNLDEDYTPFQCYFDHKKKFHGKQ
jgi:hypothetical protein